MCTSLSHQVLPKQLAMWTKSWQIEIEMTKCRLCQQKGTPARNAPRNFRNSYWKIKGRFSFEKCDVRVANWHEPFKNVGFPNLCNFACLLFPKYFRLKLEVSIYSAFSIGVYPEDSTATDSGEDHFRPGHWSGWPDPLADPQRRVGTRGPNWTATTTVEFMG